MKKNLQLIILLLSIFLLPMGTSGFLDIPWIRAEWSRSFLVYLFMLMEIALGILMLRQHILTSKNKN